MDFSVLNIPFSDSSRERCFPLNLRARSVILFLSTLLGWGIFPACHPRGTQQAPNEVTILYDGSPLTLNPNAHREVLTRSVLANCFEGLVGFDSEMRVVPLLAASWENPDDLTWVFILRPGVRFHNGRTLDAAAVVNSLTTVVKWNEGSGPGTWLIDTIYQGGTDTVVVRTRKPDPILLNRLTKVYIVSKTPQQQLESDSGSISMPSGTGPYIIEYWRGDSMGLKAYDDYWGQNIAIPRLKLFFKKDRIGQRHLFDKRLVDIVPNIKVEELKAFNKIKGMGLRRREGLVVRYLRVDPRVEPYNQKKIRKAISLAIDRQSLVDSLVGGYGRPANQMVTPVVFGYHPFLPPLGYHPDSARILIAASGYRQRKPELVLDALEIRADLARMIKRQLEAAGFACSLCLHGREEFFRGSGRPSYFFLSAVAANSGDASGVLALGGLDTLGEGEMKPAARKEILQRAMQLFIERLEYIPLFSEDDVSLVSDRIQWQPRQDMMILGKEILFKR